MSTDGLVAMLQDRRVNHRPKARFLSQALHRSDRGTPSGSIRLVAEHGGYDLMPEMGYKTVNKYLLPRPRRQATPRPVPFTEKTPTKNGGVRTAKFSAWADKILMR